MAVASPEAAARALASVTSDPSVRYVAAGRFLARLLTTTLGLRPQSVPAHSWGAFATLARVSASRWLLIAAILETTAPQSSASIPAAQSELRAERGA